MARIVASFDSLNTSQRFVVRIFAPADAITTFGAIVWDEFGKPGN
jgi:hypothetical protein